MLDETDVVSSDELGSGHCVTFDQSPLLYADKNAAQASAPNEVDSSKCLVSERLDRDGDSILR